MDAIDELYSADALKNSENETVGEKQNRQGKRKIDLKKMIIYSEILKPKFEE